MSADLGAARGDRVAAAPGALRRHNLAVLTQALSEDGPSSRAALAARTGLTKATVSKLVADLGALGIVRDAEVVQGASGRPATLVELDDRRVCATAVEIDVDELRVASIALDGTVRDGDRLDLDVDGVESSEAMRALGGLLRERFGTTSSPPSPRSLGITVAVPGLVRDGRVLVAPNLRWHDVDVAKALRRSVRSTSPGIEIVLENEANLAARAEARARQSPRGTFIYVSGGVGIGSALVVDGNLFSGAHGFGGELGHLVIDPAGSRCRCGNRGCLETVAGARALAHACGRAWRGDHAALVASIATAAAADDARTCAALDVVGAALGQALASAVSLTDPDTIVIGGILAPLLPWIAPPIERALTDRVLGSRFVDRTIEPAAAGTEDASAALLGAGLRLVQRVLDDPLLLAPR